jgi:hypothetical protein
MSLKEDLESVDRCLLESHDFTPEELKTYKRKHHKSLMKYCRRVVPSSDILAERFRRLNEVVGDIKCVKSGKKLYSPDTWKACENLLKHIENNCLSDPDDVAIHYKMSSRNTPSSTSESSLSLPLPIWYTSRGTSSQESMFIMI